MAKPYIIRDADMRRRVGDLVLNLDTSKVWEVSIEPYRKRRSLSQNNLMWSWLEKVVDHVHDDTGQDRDDIHEFFKAKFLAARRVEVNGQTVEYRSTRNLTVQEMRDYMDKIAAFVTQELGILLPAIDDR